MIDFIKKINNKKGVTLVETLVIIIISFVIITTVNSFTISLSRHKVDIRKHMEFNINVDNKIAELYNIDNWELLNSSAEIITTNNGDISLSIEYDSTNYKTDKLILSFTLDEYNKKYEIERSVYRDK